MKNILYLFVFIAFLASCKNDLIEIDSPNKEGDQIEARGTNANPFDGVVNTGRWLRFESQEHYDQVISNLEPLVGKPLPKGKKVILNQGGGDGGDGGGYGTTYDEDPWIATYEEEIGIYTLRKKLLFEEDHILRTGQDPDEILKLDDKGFLPTTIRSVVSAEGAIQIGDNIIIQEREAVRFIINDNRDDIAIDILDNGPDEAFNEEHYGFVKLDNKLGLEKILLGGGTCTAAFNVVPGGNTDAHSQIALRTFMWNLGDASMARDLNLLWTFGDGQSEETKGPIANHTFTSLQPYPAVNSFNVCLTASYSYLDDQDVEQQCLQSSCKTVEIRLEELEQEEEVDECQNLGRVFGISWFFDASLIEENTTPNEPTEVCVSLGNAALAAINETVSDNYTLKWHFQGQEGTGTNPCFYAGCDGAYMVIVQVLVDGEVCATLLNWHHHNVLANCEGKEDLKRDDVMYYPFEGEVKRTLWWAKHETNKDDSNFLGIGIWNSAPNQIETKMKHYRKYGSNWYPDFRHNRTTIAGNVYPQGEACDCGGIPDLMEELFEETFYKEFKFEKNHKVFESQTGLKGIFCKVDDPYTVSFYPLDNTTVLDEDSVDFPQ